MKYNIQWTNKYSHETGYVAKVMFKAGHFVNTASQEDAKKYRSAADAEKDILRLTEIGEAENNELAVVAYGG